jgi:hypothetical protein
MARTLSPRDLTHLELAVTRIQNILGRYTVASKRTLEAKISEAGPNNQRVPPEILTSHALPRLVTLGQVEEVSPATVEAPALYAPPPNGAGDATEIAFEIQRKLELHRLYRLYATTRLGSAAETIYETAFIASPNLHLIQPFGHVSFYNGVTLPNSVDALIQSTLPSGDLPATSATAVVEVKNRREWIYHDNVHLWELVRAAYAIDVVGIFAARRIATSAFKYAFKRVGALGIETFYQFAPPDTAAALGGVRDKFGLGFHDLMFTTTVPASVQKQVDALSSRIYRARNRMLEVRDIVDPYLALLGDVNANPAARKGAYRQLDAELRSHDFPEDDDDEDDDEDQGEY